MTKPKMDDHGRVVDDIIYPRNLVITHWPQSVLSLDRHYKKESLFWAQQEGRATWEFETASIHLTHIGLHHPTKEIIRIACGFELFCKHFVSIGRYAACEVTWAKPRQFIRLRYATPLIMFVYYPFVGIIETLIPLEISSKHRANDWIWCAKNNSNQAGRIAIRAQQLHWWITSFPTALCDHSDHKFLLYCDRFLRIYSIMRRTFWPARYMQFAFLNVNVSTARLPCFMDFLFY